MSAPANPREEAPTVLQAATVWRMRMDAPDWSAADEAAFQAWLAEDELHRRALERTGQVWDLVDSQAASPDIMVIRRDALDRAQRTARGRLARWRRPMLELPRRRALAAVAAGLLVAAGLGVYPLVAPDIYATGQNERRVVTLADGSTLSLDAMTRVSVAYSDDARRLRLLKGQARFDVAHDVSRPFSVRARDRTVVATGTAFNIDVFGGQARVTLIEGRVLVMPAAPRPGQAAPAAKPVELRAGEQLVASDDAPVKVVVGIDLQQATAWQQGKLMFDKAPLAEAVARMNRYSQQKIIVADPATGAVLVSGAFDAGNTRGFLEAVTTYLPVTATDGPEGVTLRSAAEHG